MTFTLLLSMGGLFLFLATTHLGASHNTGQLSPPQPTNKPFYFHFNPVPKSLPQTASRKKGLVWNNRTTAAPAAQGTAIAPPKNTEENDTNADRPQYQCYYHGNFLAICQELEKCLSAANRTQLMMSDNRTFDGYACDAPLVRMPYSVKNGIATRGYISVLKRKTHPLDVLFVCHFYNHELPAERSFACSAPLDCRTRGAISPCSGGIPWYGVWTGDLEVGLWGVITDEAMESG